MKSIIVCLLVTLSLISQAQPQVQKSIITKFIEAADGSTIELPAGTTPAFPLMERRG
jgi:hypothetical protein